MSAYAHDSALEANRPAGDHWLTCGQIVGVNIAAGRFTTLALPSAKFDTMLVKLKAADEAAAAATTAAIWGHSPHDRRFAAILRCIIWPNAPASRRRGLAFWRVGKWNPANDVARGFQAAKLSARDGVPLMFVAQAGGQPIGLQRAGGA